MIIATILQDKEKQKQSPELIDAFEMALCKAITNGAYHDHLSFGVDYHPDMILQEAAERAGINLGMTTLPWKTMMWIDGDTVKVACGYGAPSIEL